MDRIVIKFDKENVQIWKSVNLLQIKIRQRIEQGRRLNRKG